MTNIEVKSTLNSRQYRLYDYLKENGERWVTQEHIANDLSNIYPVDKEDFKDFHNSSCRKLIGADIRAINESDYLPKPILSTSRGIKIANEQEFDRYISSNIIAVINRLNRLKKLANKASRNNQYRLKLSEYQSDIIESFIK